MIPFEIRNQTDMIFGIGAEERCADLVKEFVGNRVLIHHSGEPFVKKLIDQIREGLEHAGLYCIELDGVVPNPHIELVYEGIDLCRHEGIDFVLGVGGGNVIDSAKLIAFGCLYDGDLWDLCTSSCTGAEITDPIYPTLPLGVIVTATGTGSEMSYGAVIHRGRQKSAIEYTWLRPKFCILNPLMTITAPQSQTSSGAADIFSHLLENYFTPHTDSDLAEHLLSAGLKTVLKHAPIVVEYPDNIHSRSELMVLAPLCLTGFFNVGRRGDWGTHTLEHAISGEWNISHGAGLAIVIPVWMRYIYKNHLETFESLAVNVFGLKTLQNREDTALLVIQKTEEFLYQKLKLPRNLKEHGIMDVTEAEVWSITEHLFENDVKTIGRTAPLRKEDCFDILHQCCISG